MKTPYHYNVRPRYTCGSPAAVDERTAIKQAAEERISYEIDLSGVHGEKQLERAELLGLGPVREPKLDTDGIERRYSAAELVIEHSNHWFVRCLITGEIFTRPFAWIHPIKTTNCKQCRRERDMAEFNALRSESRPWRSQAAKEAK